MLNELYKQKVVAVIRTATTKEAAIYTDICYQNDLKAIELTFSIPNVCELVREVCQKYDDVLVGVGSVLTKEQARDAHLAGAKYIVGPGWVKEVQEYCTTNNLIYMPGAMTVTEILNSITCQNEVTKLFPGSEFSPSYIKSIKGPIPNANLMVTGGVDYDNINDWFAAGAKLVGIGSILNSEYAAGGEQQLAAYIKKLLEKVRG